MRYTRCVSKKGNTMIIWLITYISFGFCKAHVRNTDLKSWLFFFLTFGDFCETCKRWQKENKFKHNKTKQKIHTTIKNYFKLELSKWWKTPSEWIFFFVSLSFSWKIETNWIRWTFNSNRSFKRSPITLNIWSWTNEGKKPNRINCYL